MLEFQSRRGRREEGEKREKEEKRGCLPPLLEKEEGFTVKGGAEAPRGGATEQQTVPTFDGAPPADEAATGVGTGGVAEVRPPPPVPARSRIISLRKSRVVGPTGLRGSPIERLAVIIW